MDITIINPWILYRSNHPSSAVKTQRLFRLKLIEELVQPVLSLRAAPVCPPYLRISPGRQPIASHLVGKHFPYKAKKRQHVTSHFISTKFKLKSTSAQVQEKPKYTSAQAQESSKYKHPSSRRKKIKLKKRPCTLLVWHSQPQALPELQHKGLVTHNTSTCSRPKFFIYVI